MKLTGRSNGLENMVFFFFPQGLLGLGSLAHLVKVDAVGVEQDPAELDDLGRVLGDIDTVLVASGGDVDHDISVGSERGGLLGSSHVSEDRRGRARNSNSAMGTI